MAMNENGLTEISVKVQQYKTHKVYEARVKDGITLERTPNEPSVLTCEVLRDKYAPECHDIITVTLDGGHNCFYGYIKKADMKRKWVSITAYDQLWYMQKNQAPRFIYEDCTASDIYKRIIEDNELRTVVDQHIQDTEYKIPYGIESNLSYLEIVQKALDLTYENTGKKFFVWDDYGNLCLHTEEWMADQPYLQATPKYFEDYTIQTDGTEQYSAVQIINEVKDKDNEEEEEEDTEGELDPDEPGQTLPDDGGDTGDTGDTGEGEEDEEEKTPEEEEREKFEEERDKKFVLYTARNDEAVDQIGLVIYPGTLEEGENGDFKARQLLKENEELTRNLSLTGVQGDIQVRGGTPLLVDFFSKDRVEYFRGWFSVERVTHNIKNKRHTMDLDLSSVLMLDDWKDDNPDYTFKRPESEYAANGAKDPEETGGDNEQSTDE